MKHKLIQNTLIVLGCSVAAKLLAYVWEAMMAAYLGADDTSDALYMTTSVFNVLYPILDLGIWKVFLPAYQSKRTAGSEEDADKIANGAITFFSLLSVALVAFLVLFAKPLVGLFAPGFAPEKQQVTVEFLRISAPAYLLMSVASILGAMLQCRGKFLGSQLRDIGTHVSKIIYVLICFRYLGFYAAVTAIVVGSIFRVLIQLPFLNWGWRWKPSFRFRDPELKTMLKGLPSVALTAAILHLNSFVDRIFASGAVKGAVSCLNYGNRLMTVFSGLISTAISTATYPTMIEHIARHREDELKSLLVRIIHALGFFIIPITVYCAVFSTKIVALAFQRGAFDESATALTAAIFSGYCVGMLFTGIETIIANVFYGYGDTKTILWISAAMIVLNIGLDFLFYHLMGVAGLALATSTAAVLGLTLRLILLKRYIHLPYRQLLRELLILALSASAGVACAWLVFLRVLSLPLLPTVILSFALGAVVYLLMAALLRSRSVGEVTSYVKKRLRRAK